MAGPYALWLAPRDDQRRALRELIATLSRRCGTTPFEPHVTLLGGIQLSLDDSRRQLSRLASAMTCIPLRLTGVSWGPAYYQCVFVDVAGDQELVRARDLAGSLFAVSTPAHYRPHLSLIYGDVSVETRQRLAYELGSSLRVDLDACVLELWNVSGPVAGWSRVVREALDGV